MSARRLSCLAAGLLALSACAQGPGAGAPAGTLPAAGAGSVRAPASPATGVEPTPAAKVADTSTAALPSLVVHKSPTCGCCTLWVEHMREAGFRVEVRETDDLEPVKKRLGVPFGKGSCHTAEVAGLFVEGHVPAADVRRLLAAPGDARGLVLPGMPLGSPGMESPDGRVQRYTVERIGRDGATSPFATHGR